MYLSQSALSVVEPEFLYRKYSYLFGNRILNFELNFPQSTDFRKAPCKV